MGDLIFVLLVEKENLHRICLKTLPCEPASVFQIIYYLYIYSVYSVLFALCGLDSGLAGYETHAKLKKKRNGNRKKVTWRL